MKMTPREKDDLDRLLRDLETYAPDCQSHRQQTPSFTSCEVSAPHPQLVNLTSGSQVSSPSSPIHGGLESGTLHRGRSLTKTPVGPTFSPVMPVAPSYQPHQAKPILISSVVPTKVTTTSTTKSSHPHLMSSSPSKGGTRILPGAKVDLSDEANRTGVYASTLGKRVLTRNEREELDNLINTILDEVKYFPDYHTIKGRKGYQRSASFASSTGMAGLMRGRKSPPRTRSSDGQGRSQTPEVTGLPPGGVAQTINAFESLNQRPLRSISPTPSIRRKVIHPHPRFTDHPTHPHHLYTPHPFATQASSSSSTVQRTHGVGRTKAGIFGTLGAGPSPTTQPVTPPVHETGSRNDDDQPPHLLYRPTPYQPRPDSKPFTYGVTSASPLIQRRRVHSETTAYISENRPEMPTKAGNRHFSGGATRTGNPVPESLYSIPRKANGVSGPSNNLYDNPCDLDIDDCRSEVSIGSSIYDMDGESGMGGQSWLERQQQKLRLKKESRDRTYQKARINSKKMISELINTTSGPSVKDE